MAYDIYQAFIGPYLLNIQDIEDTFEKSLAKYEFPYRDGALIEDLGQKARVVRIRCLFYGETYLLHQDLIAYLENKDVVELEHPKHGLIRGSIESLSIRHDDRVEAAEVDITFVESLLAPEPAAQPDVETELEDTYETGQQEATEEMAADLGEDLGTNGILEPELDPGLGILEQFKDVIGAERDYVAQIDEYVRTFESTLNSIANPANSLIATIEYETNLPGRVIGAMARTMERYSLLYETLKDAPVRYVQSFRDGITKLKNSLPNTSSNPAKQKAIGMMQKHITIAAGQRLSLDLAYIYRADETKRQKVRRMENQRSFDVQGNYIRPEAAGSIMTVSDVEQTLFDVRTEVQAAVNSARGMQSLKDMARQLLFHVNTIKIERDKIIQVDLDNAMPLHIVCLKYGLPYNYAERIHAINDIKNPNFASGEVNIYAR